MKNISKNDLLENIDLALEYAATMRDSFVIETESGNVVLISEKEYSSYMKIMEACMESARISFPVGHGLF